MGNQNCCQKREDEIGGLPPIGSIMRHRQGDDDGEGENICDLTNMDVAALIREEHEKQRLNQSHINLLDESIRTNQLNYSIEQPYLIDMREIAQQNRRLAQGICNTDHAYLSERKRSNQNGNLARMPSDLMMAQDKNLQNLRTHQKGSNHQRFHTFGGQNQQFESNAHGGKSPIIDPDMMQFMMADDQNYQSSNRAIYQVGMDNNMQGMQQEHEFLDNLQVNADRNRYVGGSRNNNKKPQRAAQQQQPRAPAKLFIDTTGEMQSNDYVQATRKHKRAQQAAASGSSNLANNIATVSDKDISSGHQGKYGVKSGAQGTGTNGQHNRGQSTDDSSIIRIPSKSGSEISGAEVPYQKVKLTKDVLHAFEEETRTSPFTLIQMYLDRCQEEQGEIDDLITPGSDGESSGRSSEDSDENSDESGYDDDDSDDDDDNEENSQAEQAKAAGEGFNEKGSRPQLQ